mgnify:CR=1 FL=1|tara:strand:+ start:3041 stop:3724 length:684 start_codon:yes stop_codon:yes gene_type:complete
MNYVRKSEHRGAVNFGWLDSKHSFSFGSYYDPAHMGISALRVINDDVIAPSMGFDTHGHEDMEIITYVTEGALKHKDTLGNSFVVEAGEVQRMTAGTGIKHSEFNHSVDEAVKLLQIWVLPAQKGLTPGYEQARVEQDGPLTPLVTPDGRSGSLMMHQDASLSRLVLQPGEQYYLDTASTGYLHIVRGTADINGNAFTNGDAIGVSAGDDLTVIAQESLEALWFDLP